MIINLGFNRTKTDFSRAKDFSVEWNLQIKKQNDINIMCPHAYLAFVCAGNACPWIK